MKKILISAVLAIASLGFAEDKKMPPAAAAKPALKDIVDTAVGAGSFKTLATALTEAGLIDTLKGKGPFTVFAPTDEAFAKVPKEALEALLKDKAKLTAVLTYHVVAGKVMAADVMKMKDGDKVKTVQGKEFNLGLKDGKVMVNGANVVKTDIEATNGVIHVIDSVIMPPMDIVEVAVGAGSFKTLATALTEAGLIETLKGAGPFTVFAPTDEAFAKLPKGALEKLLKDKKKLASVLTFHVVAGKVMAADVMKMKNGDKVKTVEGKSFVLGLKDGKVTVNKANVVKTDIEASNGVIHVIDTVIMPK
jgi:transforming growth factor-beta-induced protein